MGGPNTLYCYLPGSHAAWVSHTTHLVFHAARILSSLVLEASLTSLSATSRSSTTAASRASSRANCKQEKPWGNIEVFRKTTLLQSWMVGETPIAWHCEAAQVFTIVIAPTLARNNGASGYRKEQSDPDMINHFQSPHCFTNKQKMSRNKTNKQI